MHPVAAVQLRGRAGPLATRVHWPPRPAHTPRPALLVFLPGAGAGVRRGTPPRVGAAPRRFALKSVDVPARKLAFDPPPGSLLVMAGDTQRRYRHALARYPHVTSPEVLVAAELGAFVVGQHADVAQTPPERGVVVQRAGGAVERPPLRRHDRVGRLALP